MSAAQRKTTVATTEAPTTPAETMKVRAQVQHAQGWSYWASCKWQCGEAGGGGTGQHAEGWSNWASRTRKCGEVCGGRPRCGGEWAAKTLKRPPQQPAQPQCSNHWAPLTRKQHHKECSGYQNATTRRSMQGEERVTLQGLIKKLQPDSMSHRGGHGGLGGSGGGGGA